MTDRDETIIWEDPPTRKGGETGKWEVLLAPLVDQPGRWARVLLTSPVLARSTAGNMKAGKYKIPPGRWEFVSRTLGEDTGAVYARYLGPEQPIQRRRVQP